MTYRSVQPLLCNRMHPATDGFARRNFPSLLASSVLVVAHSLPQCVSIFPFVSDKGAIGTVRFSSLGLCDLALTLHGNFSSSTVECVSHRRRSHHHQFPPSLPCVMCRLLDVNEDRGESFPPFLTGCRKLLPPGERTSCRRSSV